MMLTRDITGERFERWTVLSYSHKFKQRTYWLCRCDCGTERVIKAQNLCAGESRSCGCIRKETLVKAATRHGMHFTPEYFAWRDIKRRCFNSSFKNYKDYGGRGITMCSEWRSSFPAFYEHVGSRPGIKFSIERIDNEKGYEPGNVKWATPTEQHNNKRTNRPLTLNGKTLNMAQWARELGINFNTIGARFRKRLPVEQILFKGKLPRRSHGQ